MPSIEYYGFNRTHRGHYMQPDSWIPTRGMNVAALQERLQRLVDNESRLCRIWVKANSGVERCVFWYEKPQLEDLAAWLKTLNPTEAVMNMKLPAIGDRIKVNAVGQRSAEYVTGSNMVTGYVTGFNKKDGQTIVEYTPGTTQPPKGTNGSHWTPVEDIAEIVSMSHPLVGRRVLNVHRQGHDTPKEVRDANNGVIVGVLKGVNALILVKFDGYERPSYIVPNDLAFSELWPQDGCRVEVLDESEKLVKLDISGNQEPFETLPNSDRLADLRDAEEVMTSDGYRFRRQEDGTWSDGDMTYESLDALYDACEGEVSRVVKTERNTQTG